VMCPQTACASGNLPDFRYQADPIRANAVTQAACNR
jgi:hypothetical protein